VDLERSHISGLLGWHPDCDPVDSFLNAQRAPNMEHVVLALDSRAVGGIETHVLVLGQALIKAGVRTTVLRLADHGPHLMDEQAADMDLPLRVLTHEQVSLTQWLKASGATLLHTHGYKAGFLGRLARPRHRLPVVSTFHNGDRGTGRLAAYTALDRFTSRWSKNIAVSQEISRSLPRPATFIDNFVTMPALAGSHGQKIGFVGRLSHEKGPDHFVELARRYKDLPFVMFGDGPMRVSIEASAPRNLEIMGSVPGMADYWSTLSLLVMPSRQEGLPMAALEAMSYGVPVAAFGVGGLPRLIENGVTGYLAEPGDVAGLAARVLMSATATERSKSVMREKARMRIRNTYSAEARIGDVLAVYRAAASR
jgi:glycosyltransferase involved in cell wall biosynthesis